MPIRLAHQGTTYGVSSLGHPLPVADKVREPDRHGSIRARRVWSDSRGRIWVSEWNSGNLSMHDPALGSGEKSWRAWKPPGEGSHMYAVYVDDKDKVWCTDWSSNTMLRFDPASERFDAITLPRAAASIRQILGRPGEVWLPESGTEHISVIRTG